MTEVWMYGMSDKLGRKVERVNMEVTLLLESEALNGSTCPQSNSSVYIMFTMFKPVSYTHLHTVKILGKLLHL